MNQEEFIRDICKVTPMSKSEARNSLNLIITQALAEERKRVRERVGELTIYRNNKGVIEIEENTGYYKANEITSSLDKLKEI